MGTWIPPEELTPFPGKERRAQHRYSCCVATTLETIEVAGSNPWPAVARELSSDSITLAVCRRFGARTLLSVTLGPADDSHTVLARVVRAEALPNGDWLLGCKFSPRLGNDELCSLVEGVTNGGQTVLPQSVCPGVLP